MVHYCLTSYVLWTKKRVTHFFKSCRVHSLDRWLPGWSSGYLLLMISCCNLLSTVSFQLAVLNGAPSQLRRCQDAREWWGPTPTFRRGPTRAGDDSGAVERPLPSAGPGGAGGAPRVVPAGTGPSRERRAAPSPKHESQLSRGGGPAVVARGVPEAGTRPESPFSAGAEAERSPAVSWEMAHRWWKDEIDMQISVVYSVVPVPPCLSQVNGFSRTVEGRGPGVSMQNKFWAKMQ